MTLTAALERAAQERDQAAYEERVRVFGLPALLAPYTAARSVRIPRQRVGS